MSKINLYKWHYVPSRRIPRWVTKRFDFSGENPIDGYVEERCKTITGRHYQWQLVVVSHNHTHDNAILRRKISKRKMVTNSQVKRLSPSEFIKFLFNSFLK